MEDGSSIGYFLTATVLSQDGSPVALLIDISILFILILLKAFFTASEIAIITLNDNRIHKEADEGDRISQKLLRLIGEPSRFLATIQVGVTMAGFLSAAYVADRFTSRFYALFEFEAPGLRASSMVIVTIILVYFSLVLGEMVPKRIAQNNPVNFARRVASLIIWLGVFLSPFIWLLSVLTRFILNLLRIDPNQTDRNVTEEEIRMMVDVGRESGAIHAEEKEMIENIFEFNDKDVSEIMTHRTNVVSLDVDADYAEVLEVAVHEKYTRIPVYDESLDNIIGILHIKDLLYHAAEGLKQPFSLHNMIRPPYFVPESKHIDGLFREMQRDRIQMAIVIDEYGGTAGVVTIEDLLEEIVGNIQDEYDEEEQLIVPKGADTYWVIGTTPLHEVGEVVNIDFPDDDYDTIAGLVISLLGRIPAEDEFPEVNYKNLVLKVLEMDEKRVSRVMLKIIPAIDSRGDPDET